MKPTLTLFEPPAVLWPAPRKERAWPRAFRARCSGIAWIDTRSNGTSSSSAMSIGREVDTPWPISPTWQPMITAPSAAMRTKGPISPTNAAAARPACGRANTKRAPAPAAAFSRSRRDVVSLSALMRHALS